MITNELLFHTLEINNDLILSIKKAKGRYQQELEEKRSCKVKNDKEKQSTLLQEETNVIKKNSDIWKSCSMLYEEFVNSMMQAEKKNDLLYVHKGNVLKRKSNEMKKYKRSRESITNFTRKAKKILTLVHRQCFIDIVYSFSLNCFFMISLGNMLHAFIALRILE